MPKLPEAHRAFHFNKPPTLIHPTHQVKETSAGHFQPRSRESIAQAVDDDYYLTAEAVVNQPGREIIGI
ncbi:MAG: hypothetical protein KJ057_17740 [Phycisphaerae bacterium]|nr:MAG: hypothetical protein EDS66_17295 [Planctomycetota bacterium]MBE7458867.1 hypothetical protein [Planctomycetia bacterium]MCK6466445.1 hypothetical protein [Phycisphaerae bacterium]MCL4720306.1 hypothetical protein [Phycisphaerae bacterium]MCQ3921881.1 hypothetical protein [Planctomycetota bacterium]